MIKLLVKAAFKLFLLSISYNNMSKLSRSEKRAQIYADIQAVLPMTSKGHLMDAIEYIDASFVMYDPDGRLIVCNQHFRDMYQYSEEEAHPGVHFQELGLIDVERGNVAIGDEQGGDYLERKVEYRKNPRGTFTVKLDDGRWIMTRDRRTADGSLVSIQTDITDIKETESALLVAKEEAESASRAKSEFLANMSHELRTPLNSIIGFSSILESQILTSEDKESLREYAHHVNESGIYLLKMINDILDVAKVEAGQLDLQEDKIDIAAVVKSCANMLAVRAEENEVAIEVNIADSLPYLYVDERRLKQILINLLSNGLKFSEVGGEVSLSATLGEDGGIRFLIKDTGIGMNEEELDIALSKFGQVNSSYARNHDGTGLGLNLVQSLVSAHDGEFYLTSTSKVGTTAFVSFKPDRSVTLN